MMRCDAEWLGRTFAQLSKEDLSPLLNLGSSSQRFRTVEQPYIHGLVFAPLEGRGVRVVHSDLKVAPGVDVSGDIFDDADFAKLKAVGARAVVCTHMYEHVRDRDELTRRLLELLPEGGRFFVTVPSSYHEHQDPIDTMFRPSPDELAAMFAEHEVLRAEELEGETYWAQVRRRPVTLFFRHFTRFFVPFLGWHAWQRSMRKLYWLVNPYKVSVVSGRKAVAARQVGPSSIAAAA
jgi:SAM-dependent methyltransferase